MISILFALFAFQSSANGPSRPSMCAYSVENAPYQGGCYVNPEWRMLQPNKSPLAQMDVETIRAEAACQAHRLTKSLISSFQACNADTTNHCTVTNVNFNSPASPVWQCATVREWAVNGLPIVPNPSLCPGSVYISYYDCLFLTEDQCKASTNTLNCSWIPELIQSNQGNDVASDKTRSAGYAWQYGYCMTNLAPILPLKNTLAVIKNASDSGMNTWVETGFLAFYKKFIVPSNAEDILASYGSCPFGRKAALYLTYKNLCYNTINRDFNGLDVGLFNPTAYYNQTSSAFVNTESTNTTLLLKCLKAGCDLFTSTAGEVDSGFASPAIYCDADQYKLAKMKYGAGDEMLALVSGLCAHNELLYNKTACLLAKL